MEHGRSIIQLSRRTHLHIVVPVLGSMTICLCSLSLCYCDSVLVLYSCLSILWLFSAHLSTIVEEELEDLYSDSSEDELNPLVQTPVVKDTILSWRRVYNFPSPENFRHFVESPFSPTQSEGKTSPKYACFMSFRTFFFHILCILLLGMEVCELQSLDMFFWETS